MYTKVPQSNIPNQLILLSNQEGEGMCQEKIMWLNFPCYLQTIAKTVYCHLKHISRMKGLMSLPDLEKLIHAFIFSRLDYCNGIFTGLPKKSIRQLQLIQNTPALVLTKTKKSGSCHTSSQIFTLASSL